MKVSGLVLTLAWLSMASAAEQPTTELSIPSPEIASTPLVEDFYPPASRVLGEQGKVTLRLCYNEQGKVIASSVEQGSTFRRIDDAAVKMGKLYRIKPNAVNGQLRGGCVLVPVAFSMERGAEQDNSRQTLPPAPLAPVAVPSPPPPARANPLPADPPRPRFLPLRT